MDILSLLACFQPLVSSTSVRHFLVIAETILSMTGRITMAGISRWAGAGGSYRTVNRFFATEFVWLELLVKFFETQIFDLTGEWILAGDATTVTKSGKQTHGIGHFFRAWQVELSKGSSFLSFRWSMSGSGKPIR
jgi:putative transposase